MMRTGWAFSLVLLAVLISNSFSHQTRYLNKLVKSFRKSQHLTTLNLPIERKYFHYEIDDDAFEQFYNEMQQQIDESWTVSPNYKRIFAKNYLIIEKREHFRPQKASHMSSSGPPDFAFSVIFFKKVMVTTQPDNYVRLILNCLNVLFIWFDIGVLDLYAHLRCHFHKIKQFVCRLTGRTGHLS